MADQFWERPPDLSKLPPSIKEGLSKPAPMRDTEVRARVLILPATQSTGLNHPNGRFYSAPYKPNAADASQVDGIQLEMNDFKGLHPLVIVAVTTAEVPAMFKNLLRTYKQCGGDFNALQSMIEEINT